MNMLMLQTCLLLDMVLTTPTVHALPQMDRYDETIIEQKATHEEESLYSKYAEIDIEGLFDEESAAEYLKALESAIPAQDAIIMAELQEVEGNAK